MIIASYKVINENLWLKTSIDSIYPFVDKVVIVEGCDAFMKQAIGERVTEEGLSVDGTTEMIRSYPCLLYTSPSPRDRTRSRMPSSA